MIKYDRKTVKLLVILTGISGVLIALGLVGMAYEISTTAIVVYLLCGFIYIGGAVFIYSVLNLFSGLCYIRRLKAYGYKVPDNKKEYGGDLHRLPRSLEAQDIPSSNIESKILTVANLIIYNGTLIWNVWYLLYWYNCITDQVILVFSVQMICNLYWLIVSLRYIRQCNIEKYRDDVEIDKTRKVREALEIGTIIWIFMVAVMIIAKSLFISMTDYIFLSDESRDIQFLDELRQDVASSIQEVDGVDELDSYQQLTQGCYLSDWRVPDDALEQKIADAIGITNYSELEEKIRNCQGMPQIYVQVTGDTVYVRWDNPIRLSRDSQQTYEMR